MRIHQSLPHWLARWLTSPSLWLPLALVLLASYGAALLQDQAFVALSERDRGSYGHLHEWQARFDALSATCGVGLLTYSLKNDYTPAGRWLLAGLGISGAMLYLVATRQALLRMWRSDEAPHGVALAGPGNDRVPSDASSPAVGSPEAPADDMPALSRRPRIAPVGLILVAFVTFLALASVIAWFVAAAGTPLTFGDATLNAISAGASLGWIVPGTPTSFHAIYATIALLGALGWTLWLLPADLWLALRRGTPRGWRSTSRPLKRGFLAYLLLLAGAAALITMLEIPPRSGLSTTPAGVPATSAVGTRVDRLAGLPVDRRYQRSLILVTATAGAGLATEPIADRGVTDGTKFILALLELMGGVGPSPGGGIRFLFVLGALTGGVALLGFRWRRRLTDSPPGEIDGLRARRVVFAGVTLTGAVFALAVIIALGLLWIEGTVGSSFQSPPTFADAFLEASSAVAGGGLTTGLTNTLTSFNLSRGIGHQVDLYQYGMKWLIGAMFIGRVLPIWVLGRVAAARLT